MKFAVIEYSSKTKQIWRHTHERPNYLCDPIKEIDPTSFGCYVSALEGEHIPLTALISGEFVHPITSFVRRVEKRLSGSWTTDYNISYLKQFDALLVVYQLQDGHELVAFLDKLKKDHPKCVVIGVPTQPYGILQDYWKENPNGKKEIQEFMKRCDTFLTIVKRTLPIWKKMTSAEVLYMPQPYPVDYASLMFKPRERKSNIIFVAGVTGRDEITKGQIVAKKLQKIFPHYRIQMAEIPGMELDVTNLKGSTYDIIPFQPWQEHLAMLSKVALVVNTDYTQTRGRVQVDCAAVGTVSIGANSDAQDDLFPKLLSERETTVDQLVLQGKQLLSDSSYYGEIVRTAKDRLEQYSYLNSKNRMEALISDIKKRRMAV